MSFVQTVHPCEAIVNRLATFRTWATEGVRDSRLGLGIGLAVSALAGAPTPLPQIALAGPIVATLAYRALGGRAAAAVGFVSYIALDRPSAASTIAAGALSILVGWAVPLFLDRASEEGEGRSNASAIVVDCDGFSSLDTTYGDGTSGHVFDMLHRALKMETRDSDLVVHVQDQELILVLDGSTPAVAQAVMARVERRFSGWLADAGYDCNLSVGLATGDAAADEIDEVLRASRRPLNGPYLD